MDIVEFAEKFMRVELLEYQKNILRAFEKLRSDGKVRVVTGRDGRSYIYIDKTMQRELTQNGKTPNCYH